MTICSQHSIKQPFVSGVKEAIGSTASRCHLFGSMGRVARKLVATPKCPRPLVSWQRLAAPSPRGIRHLSKEALRQHLMKNSLDTSGTRQQMVSRLSAFSKAAKVHSENQRPESKQAPDQHPEDNSTSTSSTSDSSEARDPIAHKSDPGSDSLEAPAKPQSKLSFLGLELVSVSQQIRLPPEKLREILEEPTKWQTLSVKQQSGNCSH